MKHNRTARSATAVISIVIVIVLGISTTIMSNETVQMLSSCTSYAFAEPEEVVLDAIGEEDYEKAVKVYNRKIAGDKTREGSVNPTIEKTIDGLLVLWTTGEEGYKKVFQKLKVLKRIDNESIKRKAKDTLKFVYIEKNGHHWHSKAEKQFADGRYFKALKSLMKVKESYSEYDSVIEFKGQCEEILTTLVSSPQTKNEYKTYQARIDRYLEIDPESQMFKEQKTELANQKSEFDNAAPVLKKARTSFTTNHYAKAFNCLEKGIEKYPDNQFLRDTLDEYHSIYLVATIQKVKKKVEKEEYKEAKTIIKKAQEIYPCDELDAIKAYVSENQYFIVKAGHNIRDNIVEQFESLKAKLESGEINKETARKEAKAYITQSGEKLVLGDYSEKEITILSAGGEIMTSIIGVDAAIDVRDLSYDITHWGEEDYFAVRLATDVVALVPVVGAVKYLKYSKEAGKGIKKGVKTAKDVVGGTSTASKQTNRIMNTATSVANNADESASITKTVMKHYKRLNTVNASLAGRTHPISGVAFAEKKIETPDGRKLVGVFPKFNAKAEVTLPPNLYRATDYEQNKYLIKDLQRQANDGEMAGKFSAQEIELIKEGRIPDGCAWHKSEESGVMQLVDKNTLNKTECTDGTKLWARGSRCLDVVKGESYISKDEVAKYINKFHELPPNYITKKEAAKMGWRGGDPSDTCDGKIIGGDSFRNDGTHSELSGNKAYFECDVDYTMKDNRGANRLVYSKDGEVFYTGDHYRTLKRIY